MKLFLPFTVTSETEVKLISVNGTARSVGLEVNKAISLTAPIADGELAEFEALIGKAVTLSPDGTLVAKHTPITKTTKSKTTPASIPKTAQAPL